MNVYKVTRSLAGSCEETEVRSVIRLQMMQWFLNLFPDSPLKDWVKGGVEYLSPASPPLPQENDYNLGENVCLYQGCYRLF